MKLEKFSLGEISIHMSSVVLVCKASNDSNKGHDATCRQSNITCKNPGIEGHS